MYREELEDENFILKHTVCGILSMVNGEPNANGFQFCYLFVFAFVFICAAKTERPDGPMWCVGRMVKAGMSIVKAMEHLGCRMAKPARGSPFPSVGGHL
ncbi:rCG29000, partial [Rattus norvegicus]